MSEFAGSDDATVPPPESEDPTFAQAWSNFQSQGGLNLGMEASLEGDVTLAPADTDPFALGPADVELAGLERLELEGERPDFKTTSLLGSGGMGEVHLAVDRGLRREVALKTVKRGAGTRGGRCLMQEALYTGFLEHPNVVPVHRLGRDPAGKPVFVMKRIVGTSWSDLLRDPEHRGWNDLSEDRLRANLDILSRVCDAVRYAHSRGILHRDIKPSNVMVGEFGEVYLVDWGLAIRIDDLQRAPIGIVGTLAFMAPEMLEEPTKVTRQTDVYLLGATLHQALTGRPRHDGSAHYNTMLSVFRSEPYEYGPDVPRELADLCNRATHVDPAQRPATALEFRRALERFLEHRGSVALTNRAMDKLAELEAVYALPGDNPTLRAPLFDACRSGFDQALQIWPENESAADGLQRCLELTIERELEARNEGLIETLLPTLPRPRADLEERLQTLKAELAEAADAPAKLEAIEREHDLRVASGKRAVTLIVMAVVGYGILAGFLVLLQTGVLKFTYDVIFGVAILLGVLMLVQLKLVQKWLLSNEVNRRMVKMTMAAWVGGVLNILMCWAYAMPGWVFLVNMGLVLFMLGAMATAAVDKRIGIPTAVGGVTIFFGFIFGEHDPILVHIIAGLIIFGSIAFIWWRDPPK